MEKQDKLEELFLFLQKNGAYLEKNTIKEYTLDINKIKTIDDIKLILNKLNIVFYGEESIKGIEHLVKEKQ